MFIPAFIFIGIGTGLLFGRPDVGAVAGLGAGLIAMGVSKMLTSSGEGEHSAPGHSVVPILIGCLFVIAGFGLVYFPALIWPYFGALH